MLGFQFNKQISNSKNFFFFFEQKNTYFKTTTHIKNNIFVLSYYDKVYKGGCQNTQNTLSLVTRTDAWNR